MFDPSYRITCDFTAERPFVVSYLHATRGWIDLGPFTSYADALAGIKCHCEFGIFFDSNGKEIPRA